MKYFTPERYLNLGNLDDEQKFLAAQEQWEKAIAGYQVQLKQIRTSLPSSLRGLIETVYLHDARVLTMHRSDDDFFIILQPLTTPAHLIVLGYSLVEDPTIKQNVLPRERCREPIEWLYDELELDRPEKSRGKPTIRHNILLSNGWEVRLRFRSAWVKRPVRVIPVVPEHNDAGTVGARSA
jgi:hypothetical protein